MSAEVVDELGHLTQALQIEELRSVDQRKGCRGVFNLISGIEGDSDMTTIG